MPHVSTAAIRAHSFKDRKSQIFRKKICVCIWSVGSKIIIIKLVSCISIHKCELLRNACVFFFIIGKRIKQIVVWRVLKLDLVLLCLCATKAIISSVELCKCGNNKLNFASRLQSVGWNRKPCLSVCATNINIYIQMTEIMRPCA